MQYCLLRATSGKLDSRGKVEVAMRGALTAFLSLRVWKGSALTSGLDPAHLGSTAHATPNPAPCLAFGQSQTIRHFIAMAQAARRAREP